MIRLYKWSLNDRMDMYMAFEHEKQNKMVFAKRTCPGLGLLTGYGRFLLVEPWYTVLGGFVEIKCD